MHRWARLLSRRGDRLKMPNVSVKHVRVVARHAASEDPERVLFIGAVTDITERKRAEETLREQADLLNLTHDAIFVRDMDGIVKSWIVARRRCTGGGRWKPKAG
jgi:PAS domain-containing protein